MARSKNCLSLFKLVWVFHKLRLEAHKGFHKSAINYKKNLTTDPYQKYIWKMKAILKYPAGFWNFVTKDFEC